MSVAPSEALERSVLEGKDREQLLTIAAALGVKPPARAKKADIIDKILEQVGVPTGASAPAAAATRKPVARGRAARNGDAEQPALTLDGGDDADAAAVATAAPAAEAAPGGDTEPAPAAPTVVLGPDGEPLAEWELDLGDDGEGDDDGDDDGPGSADAGQPGQMGEAGEAREGRRRRRRRNRNRTGEDGVAPSAPIAPAVTAPPMPERAERSEDQRIDIDAFNNEPVEVAGYVDLREEGFGFLRVHGYLASRDDIYVSVKQVRQFGLRRGDHVGGTSRPAGRNEKNPALLSVTSVNGADPETSRGRRRFDELTPVVPTSPLPLESVAGGVTGRIVDLLSPIGKGSRVLVVAPPRAGRTSVLTAVAAAIEANHPALDVIVVLVDERPEEVTEVRRAVKGEVIASTFDNKPGEHAQVAEMAVEKAKRLVEAGRDVVIVADGLTRLARAYNLAAPASGRVLASGLDAAAVHPAKRFFGAGRVLAEGGSLTMIATAMTGTGSKADEVVLDELWGTATAELRLDRSLADRLVHPAIDVEGSTARHEAELVGADGAARRRALRATVVDASTPMVTPLEVLLGRLAATPTNAGLLGS